MVKLLVISFVLPLLILTTGCRDRIQWGAPGTIGQQRARAQVYDPYPDNDLGPAIVSGRPPGFERPSSPVRRLQQDNPHASRRPAPAPASW